MNNVKWEGISIVTTTYNERDNIRNLIIRIKRVLDNIPHEIIAVDDTVSLRKFR
ncbi:MAG: hypothetical protein ACP5IZ_04885 [Thermoprotei archaeon]